MEDEALAAALGTLPQLTALQLGDTPAGDATLGALTFAYRAAAWAQTYGARRLTVLDTPCAPTVDSRDQTLGGANPAKYGKAQQS